VRAGLSIALALAACGPPGQPSTDAAVVPESPDASLHDAARDDRREPVAAVAYGDEVVWIQGGESCPLESGPECPAVGPSVLRADQAGTTIDFELETQHGGRAIVADAAGTFVLLADDTEPERHRLVRLHAGEVLAFVVEDVRSEALAIDDTYVYWNRMGVDGQPGGLMRATRSGNGTDRVTLVDRELAVHHIEIVGDWIYWVEASALWRVQVGGTPEAVGTDMIGAIEKGDGVLYAWRSNGSDADLVEIDLDGNLRVIAEATLAGEHLTSSGGELFWATIGEIRRVPVSGGTPVTVVADPFGAFGVTTDAVLHDFSSFGFRAVAR
jgi:hypothetical protein